MLAIEVRSIVRKFASDQRLPNRRVFYGLAQALAASDGAMHPPGANRGTNLAEHARGATPSENCRRNVIRSSPCSTSLWSNRSKLDFPVPFGPMKQTF